MRHRAPAAGHRYSAVIVQSDGICMSPASLALFMTAALALVVSVIILAIVIKRREKRTADANM